MDAAEADSLVVAGWMAKWLDSLEPIIWCMAAQHRASSGVINTGGRSGVAVAQLAGVRMH
jgi:hypothetical protein